MAANFAPLVNLFVIQKMREHTSTQCIYCSSEATEREHVPPRCLLEKPYPPNLQTLPVCAHCNRGFALDEEYFIVLLSQIGTSDALTSKIGEGGSVDRALSHSPRLDDRITDALSVSNDGRVMISPELPRVLDVVGKIALGLFVLRYRQVPSLREIECAEVHPYNIEESRPVATFVSTFTEHFRPKRWTTVQEGVFSYIFVRPMQSQRHLCCIMDFHSTAWGVAHVPIPRRFRSRRRTKSDPLQFQLKFDPSR